MHPKGHGELNIRGSAGTGDEDEVRIMLGFREDLMHVRPEHRWLDDSEVVFGQQRYRAWFLRRRG